MNRKDSYFSSKVICVGRMLALVLFTSTLSVGQPAAEPADQPVSFHLTFDKATNRLTAWYAPTVSSTHRLITAQFSIVTSDGYTAPESGTNRDSKLEITSIKGAWMDYVFDNDLFMHHGKSPLAALEGLAVHQVGMAPQVVDIGAVQAGVPVPLFSFPATGKAGDLRILATDEPIQKEILKLYGSNINNEMTLQSPVKAYVRAKQQYTDNHRQNGVSFIDPKPVDGLSQTKAGSGSAQTVGLENALASQEALTVTPNPASSNVEITYRILSPGRAGVSLVDLQGKVRQVLVEARPHEIGLYKTSQTLDPALPGGIYLVLLQGEGEQKSTRVALQK